VYDLDHEVPIGCLAHQFAPLIGPVREQVLEPRPAFADCLDDLLCARGILHVGGSEVDHQQPPVRIDHDVPLTALDLLGVLLLKGT
jgi:hypothetical protein